MLSAVAKRAAAHNDGPVDCSPPTLRYVHLSYCSHDTRRTSLCSVAPITECIVQVAPSDYMKVLLRYVDVENIPEYLGGGCEAAVVLVIVAVPQRLSWQLCAMWSAQVLPCI